MKTLQKSAMWLMALVACIQTTQIQAANKNGSGPPSLLNQNSATIAMQGLNRSQLLFPGQTPPIIPTPGSGSPNPGTGNPNHPDHHHYFPWRNLVWHWNYPCPYPCGYTCGTVCVNGNWIGCTDRS